MPQLDLLPTNFFAVAREHQNVEGIQFPNRSRGNDHSVLIVNAKGVRSNSFSVTDNLCGVRIIGHAAAEKQRVTCACGAVRHLAVLRILAQQPEGSLLSLAELDRRGTARQGTLAPTTGGASTRKSRVGPEPSARTERFRLPRRFPLEAITMLDSRASPQSPQRAVCHRNRLGSWFPRL